MAAVADSGALYALYDADDLHHAGVVAAFEALPPPILVPSGVLAEATYLLHEYLGDEAEQTFLRDLATGAFQVEELAPIDLARAIAILERYRDLRLGFADALVAATAQRQGMCPVVTVDRRHFGALRSVPGDSPFTILP